MRRELDDEWRTAELPAPIALAVRNYFAHVGRHEVQDKHALQRIQFAVHQYGVAMADVRAGDPATVLLARLFASSTEELAALRGKEPRDDTQAGVTPVPPLPVVPPPSREALGVDPRQRTPGPVGPARPSAGAAERRDDGAKPPRLSMVPPPSREGLGVDPRSQALGGTEQRAGMLGGRKRIKENEPAEIEWWTQQGPARFQQLSDHIASLAELRRARDVDSGVASDEYYSVQDSLRRACSAWVKRVSPILADQPTIAPNLAARDIEIKELLADLTELTEVHGGKSAKRELEPFGGKGGSVGSLFETGTGALWKIEGKAMVQPPRKEGLYQWGASSITGIQPFGALLTNRAVASSRVDSILETNVYARTELKVIGGRVGQEMEKLTGDELKDIKGTQRQELEQQGWFKAQRERLLLVNYITRQADPHEGNVMVNREQQTVKEFDLDFSFGKRMDKRDELEAQLGGLNIVPSLSMPTTIEEALAGVVLRPRTRQEIQDAIKKLLPADEVDATLDRFDKVVAAVRSGAIKTVVVATK